MPPPPSPRLLFREWSSDDSDLAWQLWGDVEVSRLLSGPYSPEQVQQRLESHLEFTRRSSVQYWPMFLRESGAFVGCCGIKPPENGVHEHGFHLRPAFWGQGFGYEAARAVIAHAFNTVGASGLWAGHHPDNDVSRRLLLKLGFRFTFMDYYQHTGLWHPAYHLWAVDQQIV